MYLGYVVSREGISPDPQKLVVVRDLPQPHDVKTLRSFLGLASYYKRFILGFSKVASPLFFSTKKDVDILWSPASRTLQAHERNYGVTELEALGVVWAKDFR